MNYTADQLDRMDQVFDFIPHLFKPKTGMII